MLLIIFLSIVFVLSSTLLFIWVRKKNKNDPEEEKMSVIMTGVVVSVLALIITGVAAFLLFFILGSTNVVNALFTLDMSKQELILLAVVYFVYLITLDNVWQAILTFLTGHLFLFYFVMLWFRMVIFYLIGDYFSIAHYANLLIAGGVALMVSLGEFLFDWSQKKKQ